MRKGILRNAQLQFKGFRDASIFEDKSNEICQIENFVLSSKEEYLAIALTRNEICQYYKVFEYKIVIVGIHCNAQISQGEWLGSYKQHDIFCQFSVCSKYLVDHSNQTLNIRNIQQKSLVRIHNIQQVYFLNEQNFIYLLKGNNIQIYSINTKTFREIITGGMCFTQLLVAQPKIFLGVKEIFQIFFFSEQKRIPIFSMKNTFINSRKGKIYEKDNILLLTYCNYQVQLRNIKNFKLLRSIFLSTQDKKQFIKHNDDYYLYQAISQFPLIFEQLNLVTGKATEISFQQNVNLKLDEEIYFTNCTLINIQQNHKILKYFSFQL